MTRISSDRVSVALLVLIAALTLTTAYIHYNLGGLLFTLNAAGYLALAAAVLAPISFFRRVRPLTLLALAGYTATTIIGWVIMGPYFTLAYYTKAIEVVMLGVIGVELFRTRGQIVPSIVYLRDQAVAVVRRGLRREAHESVEA